MSYDSCAKVCGPIKTTGGLIKGFQYDDVYQFKGIKYAIYGTSEFQDHLR
ncbi:MAG: hypothetical protein IJM15_00245 [Erysipelotrichaceae bacterium]|nr:hypothetical protein [Erysipelotrichaceae bacterium]